MTRTNQSLRDLSSGLAGVRETLAYMRQYVEQYKTHPTVRELALKLTRQLPQKDYLGEARALHAFVKNNIRYVRDVHGVETVQTPLKTLEYLQGDCDDKSSLLAAMLQSLGHQTRFHAMGFRPGNVCHVLVEVQVPGRGWVPLETTEPVQAGWIPPRIRESIYNESPAGGLSGLSGSVFGNLFSSLDKNVLQPITGHFKPVVVSPVFQKVAPVVATVLQFIPGVGTAIGAGVAAAAAAGRIQTAAEIKRAVANNDKAALAQGAAKFDGAAYMRAYPDVAADPYYKTHPFEHYAKLGVMENRTAFWLPQPSGNYGPVLSATPGVNSLLEQPLTADQQSANTLTKSGAAGVNSKAVSVALLILAGSAALVYLHHHKSDK